MKRYSKNDYFKWGLWVLGVIILFYLVVNFVLHLAHYMYTRDYTKVCDVKYDSTKYTIYFDDGSKFNNQTSFVVYKGYNNFKRYTQLDFKVIDMNELFNSIEENRYNENRKLLSESDIKTQIDYIKNDLLNIENQKIILQKKNDSIRKILKNICE